MKNILRSRIFTFVVGAIIFSGITGVAAYTMIANKIGYTPKDSTWKKSNGENITNVEEALDELYGEKSVLSFNELYSYAASSPSNFSYTFPENTKNVVVYLSAIRCDGCGEADSSISLPENAVALYSTVTPECFKGTCGSMRAETYYIPNASGTISGRISYRGNIKITQVK